MANRHPPSNKRSSKRATHHPSKRLSHHHQRAPADGWETFHLLLAACLIFGVFISAHNLAGLIDRIYRFNGLEESGFIASSLVLVRGVRQRVAEIAEWIVSWFRR